METLNISWGKFFLCIAILTVFLSGFTGSKDTHPTGGDITIVMEDGVIFVSVDDGSEPIDKISVYLSGTLVDYQICGQVSCEMDISHLESGIYNVKVLTTGGSEHNQLISIP